MSAAVWTQSYHASICVETAQIIIISINDNRQLHVFCSGLIHFTHIPVFLFLVFVAANQITNNRSGLPSSISHVVCKAQRLHRQKVVLCDRGISSEQASQLLFVTLMSDTEEQVEMKADRCVASRLCLKFGRFRERSRFGMKWQLHGGDHGVGKDPSLALIKTVLTLNVSLIVFPIGARLKCTRKIAFFNSTEGNFPRQNWCIDHRNKTVPH